MVSQCDGGHEPKACDGALRRAFAFLGKRWNGVLLGTLASGPASYSGLKRAITGISDSVLSERLSELAKADLIQRTVGAGPPVAVEYRLTPAGLALLPALDELTTWAAENLPADPATDKPKAVRSRPRPEPEPEPVGS